MRREAEGNYYDERDYWTTQRWCSDRGRGRVGRRRAKGGVDGHCRKVLRTSEDERESERG